MDEFPPTQPPPPMTLDGADEDAVLANSRVLTQRELVARRLRRVRQLARVYRGHYWALMDDVKSKYRDYIWNHGKIPFKDGVVLGKDAVRCAFGGCKSKAMVHTSYCHAHILSDPTQKLYQGCKTIAKILPTGPSYCNKPVLRSTFPSACPTHYQLSEKCLLRAIKRAGYSIPTTRKPNPKFHVLVTEFVRQIHHNRKVALKATVPKAETE